VDNSSDDPPISITMPYPAPFILQRSHANSRQCGQGRNDGSSYNSSTSNSRRGSVDFSGSDGTSVSHASGSVPCSANASSVHLPLGNAEGNSLGYSNVSVVLYICISLKMRSSYFVSTPISTFSAFHIVMVVVTPRLANCSFHMFGPSVIIYCCELFIYSNGSHKSIRG
jgi:hypothetical protein